CLLGPRPKRGLSCRLGDPLPRGLGLPECVPEDPGRAMLGPETESLHEQPHPGRPGSTPPFDANAAPLPPRPWTRTARLRRRSAPGPLRPAREFARLGCAKLESVSEPPAWQPGRIGRGLE